MANNQSNGGSADTPESLRAEREDLEATAACMRQMARDLDAMAEQRKSFDVERFASFLQMKGPDMRIRVWAGIRSPEGFQWYKEWMARKKALMEQVLQHLATFVQAAILWEEDLERRERQQQAALLASPSEPVVTGGNGVMPDKFGGSAWLGNGLPEVEIRESQHTNPGAGHQIANNAGKDRAPAPINRDKPPTIGKAFKTLIHTVGSDIYGFLDETLHKQYDPVPDDKKSVLDLYEESMHAAQDMDPTTPRGLGHAIFGVGMVAVGEAAAESAPAIETPKSLGKIAWVNEGIKKGDAFNYEKGAIGWIEGKAPKVSATDSGGTVSAKFDGVEGSVLIDRKWSITSYPKTERQALRQSVVAIENGYTVRWEVPNAGEARRAVNIIKSLGIKNIRVVVEPAD